LLVLGAEALRMEGGPGPARIARQRHAGLLIDVARAAVRHALGGGDLVVVAVSAVVHLWQIETNQRSGFRHVLVTRSAVHVVVDLVAEVRCVGELDVLVMSGDDLRRNHRLTREERGILDRLGIVTTLTVSGGGCGAQVGLHAGLGMAGRTLFVASEERAFFGRLMTEGTIRAEARLRVEPFVRINVLGVIEVNQDRTLLLKTREGVEFLGAGGRKRCVALGTDLLVVHLIERILMASDALIVSGTLEGDGAFLDADVTGVAVEANFADVLGVKIESWLS